MLMVDTKRFCLVCDDIKTFKFDKIIGHSKCCKCGNRFGVAPDNTVLIHFQEKIKKLEEYYNNDSKTGKAIETLTKRLNSQKAHLHQLKLKFKQQNIKLGEARKKIKQLEGI